MTERAMTNRTPAIVIAVALVCSSQAVFVGPSHAQSTAQSSDGNGVSNFRQYLLARNQLRRHSRAPDGDRRPER
jgi:hypothetical protein